MLSVNNEESVHMPLATLKKHLLGPEGSECPIVLKRGEQARPPPLPY